MVTAISRIATKNVIAVTLRRFCQLVDDGDGEVSLIPKLYKPVTYHRFATVEHKPNSTQKE